MSIIITSFNRPARNVILNTELAANAPSFAAVSFRVDPSQLFALSGIRAEGISFENSSTVQFFVVGVAGQQIFPQQSVFDFLNNSAQQIFFSQQCGVNAPPNAVNFLVQEDFARPVLYYDPGFYTFLVTATNVTATLNMPTNIEIFGELLDREDQVFPYKFR